MLPGRTPRHSVGWGKLSGSGCKASAAANGGTLTRLGLTQLSFSCTICGRSGLALHPHCVPPHRSYLRKGDKAATKVTAGPLKSWNAPVCPPNPAEDPKSESIGEPPESAESIQKRVESILETSETCAAGLFRAGTAPLCALAWRRR